MEIREDINDIAKLVELATQYNAVHWPVWFRGQSDIAWDLVPKIWRHKRPVKLEPVVAETFRTYAHSRSQRCPGPTDLGGWLSLMQHYGAPTRLLDWSESVLVAAYFAVASVRSKDADGALFMVPPKALNREEGKGDTVLSLGRSPELVVGAFFQTPDLAHIKPVQYRAVAVVGDEVDPRQSAQRSTFTVHPDGMASMLDHPEAEKLVFKYRIPKGRKASLLAELEQLQICRQTIFPDLQGLGDYLRELHESGRMR